MPEPTTGTTSTWNQTTTIAEEITPQGTVAQGTAVEGATVRTQPANQPPLGDTNESPISFVLSIIGAIVGALIALAVIFRRVRWTTPI
ncbi:hypothetical protein [Haladaptatus sp. DFWS20]|uniref:hypothetical protein n=1 Tax=Haladaptatus sp. DFWS20 TaxID=3403467 RepID=UPI003EBF3108